MVSKKFFLTYHTLGSHRIPPIIARGFHLRRKNRILLISSTIDKNSEVKFHLK